jgi:hypothetical protein
MQIFGPDESHSKMADAIGHVLEPEATPALVRLALYSPDAKARQAAASHLKSRRGEDYTEALVAGFRYPLPIVAQRAAEAVVRLERKDLFAKLIEVLESDDPRLPVAADHGFEARELVRINHHRNCLLCHAPFQTKMTVRAADQAKKEGADATGLSPGEFTLRKRGIHIDVPLPGQSFPLPSETNNYYDDQRSLDEQIVVRAEVTYLRQDFSVMQSVEDSAPWPHRQRFDFLVRRRTMTAAEAKDLAVKLRPQDGISPYHRAAAYALAELSGLQATTAGEWRRLLKLPR